MGCSRIVIRNRLLKYNIPIKTTSEARKGKFKGEKAGNYIDNRSYKQYYCIELNCGKKITKSSGLYGQGRCQSCSSLKNAKLRMKKRRSYEGKNNPKFGKVIKPHWGKYKGIKNEEQLGNLVCSVLRFK